MRVQVEAIPSLLSPSSAAFPPRDTLVAYDGTQVVGVIHVHAMANGDAVVWPPQTDSAEPAIADALLMAAIERVRSCRVLQAFLSPEQSSAATVLERHGFRHTTRLLRLEWHGPLPTYVGPTVQLVPANEYALADVAALVALCHEDSLDCPELNGQHTAAEMMAGYVEVAPDRTQWPIVVYEEQPIGIIIRHADEVSFFGIVPAWRGRGFGRATFHAFAKTSAKIALFVDVRNQPALKLYHSFGMVETAFHEVFLKLL